VSSTEELRVATWLEDNTEWRWNQDAFDRANTEVGDLGAPTMYLPRSNVQDLYINTMGVEQATYALYDWTADVEAYFRALDTCHDRLIDVVNASPIDIINFGDNLHSSTLSPSLFRQYHLPTCQRRCERLHAAGKFVSSHWDGDCGPLLPSAKETGLDGIEAITPQPQGDVALAQIKEALGDELFLLDGIPAIYFEHTFPVALLIETVQTLIELFAPKLVLGISDELSSTGDIERVRLVGELVEQYNAGV
jgi:uroporphyrinogen-III decarboxylase